MQTMLQDGVYDAQLANVAKFKTANGRDALEFLWAIEKPRISVKSVLVMTKDDGTPNTTGISLTQGWAKDWKGDDINWFIANLSFAKFYRVSVTIEGGKVKWVNERNYWASRSKSKSGVEVEERMLQLPDLLWALDRIKGDFWVRVLYSYPSEITEDFIIWMMTSKHAVHYLDVPIQHTDPVVLAKMNRRAAIDASRSATEVLRSLIPDITLRTTIMTGFPGETEIRFAAMLADLKRMQFDRLGAFAYSPEAGTRGATMKGRPSRAVAEKREKLVMEQAKALWRVKAKRLLGRTFEALVVAPGVARMASQAPDVDGVVYLVAAKGARTKSPAVGTFVKLQLVRACGFDFEGEQK